MKKILLRIATVLSLISCPMFPKAETLLFIGDSITDGNWGSRGGAPSKDRIHDDYNHIFGHGFMEMTAGYFMGEYPNADLTFHNRGIGGQRLADLSARWQEDVIALHPDVVSILIGTNDVHHHLDHPDEPFGVDGFKQQLDSLISLTTDSLPGVKIVLCTPFVAKSGWVGQTATYQEREQLVRNLASAVRQIADSRNLTVVPFDNLIASLVSNDKAPEYWIWDGIHPTTAAHYRMARLWIETMEPQLAFSRF